MKNNKMMKASVASAMLLGLVAPTVLATTNVATATAAESKQDSALQESLKATTGHDSITITSHNGIPLDKETFNAYRLMDAHYVKGENDTREEAYVIIPKWQKFFNKEVKGNEETKCSDEEAAKYLANLQKDPAGLKKFQEHVFDYANDHSIEPLGTKNAERNTYTISNLPDGYYSVIQVADENTVSLSYNILVTVDGHDTNAKVDLKADVPSLLKTMNGTDDPKNDKKAMDFAIGDDVPFRLVSKVPDMSGFEADKDGKHGGRYVFEVCDTMSKGLTLDPNSIDIKIDGKEYKDFDYVKTGDNKFRLVFGINSTNGKSDDCTKDKDGCTNTTPSNDKDVLSDADGVLNDEVFKKNTGKPIVITYKAKLNANAVLGKEGNANTANVLYSNNPYKPENVNHTWDSTTHAFTFGLDLTKVDDNQKALAGAEFQLTTNDGTEIKVKQEKDGSYVVSKDDDAVSKVVSSKDGKIFVKGLDAGSYQLKETKAPAGYNLLEKPIKFTISPKYKEIQPGDYTNIEGILEDLTVTGTETGHEFSADATKGTVSTTVVNKAGGLLPKTGGRGIFMLAAIGLALMALATYVLFGRKKATK
ncbi:SpaA isopeptide-forming pilin-related protein [Catellicoccus marimammalium]|uniref:Cell wall surface anchor family protein n=1 Tax=Catellicoccus marimammalium M35/04/3 TaxID=1234409 RepID=K8ZCL3_9ENTE|nr:SpaA isopeptide-forming pilin-related protein [Catellicoccus marimammalium]EKU27792.1 Cell wall surface anchor family protein [Catellicoccus marimammalium M35/04/3]